MLTKKKKKKNCDISQLVETRSKFLCHSKYAVELEFRKYSDVIGDNTIPVFCSGDENSENRKS